MNDSPMNIIYKFLNCMLLKATTLIEYKKKYLHKKFFLQKCKFYFITYTVITRLISFCLNKYFSIYYRLVLFIMSKEICSGKTTQERHYLKLKTANEHFS